MARLLAGREVKLDSPLRWLGWPTVASLAGCSLLLQSQHVSGAVAGSLLLGVGFGSLHPVTLTLIGRRYLWEPVRVCLRCSLVMGDHGAAYLSSDRLPRQTSGIEVVVWIVAGNALLAFLLLATVLVETRLAKEAGPVRH